LFSRGLLHVFEAFTRGLKKNAGAVGGNTVGTKGRHFLLAYRIARRHNQADSAPPTVHRFASHFVQLIVSISHFDNFAWEFFRPSGLINWILILGWRMFLYTVYHILGQDFLSKTAPLLRLP
jgi:hypothetical protein